SAWRGGRLVRFSAAGRRRRGAEGPEAAGVGAPRQHPRGVEIAAASTRLRVAHCQRVLDVRERPVEDPERLVQAAAVDRLDDQFDVGRLEEPESAGVGGERDRLAGALVAGEVAPGDLEGEATAQTE